jgi:hypothetical protein
VHLARDDRPGQLAERVTYGALRRGACCGGVRGIGAAGSGPRRCAIALEEAGQAAPPQLVGVAGFEPAASSSRRQSDTPATLQRRPADLLRHRRRPLVYLPGCRDCHSVGHSALDRSWQLDAFGALSPPEGEV